LPKKSRGVRSAQRLQSEETSEHGKCRFQNSSEEEKVMKKVSKVFAIAALIAAMAQFAAPVYARSSKCYAVPDPNNPGTYIIICSTSRP
jgi:hypothetical protein